MDLTTGQILFEQNADARIPPASLTKVLTLFLAFDEVAAGRVRLTDRVRVSSRAAEEGGSTMKLEAGERVEFYELLKGMAVASGNDACIAVAQHLAPSVDVFVERMNRKAKSLGMRNSRFVNPNGLPAKGQVTTARDMLALASSYLHRHPEALKIHGLATITHNDYTRRNSNHLLGQVEGVDGLKTGYVDASGYNIIVTGKRDGHRLIAVVLGGATSRQRDREAKRVLNAGFRKVGAPGTVLAGSDKHGRTESTRRDPLSVAANSILGKGNRQERKSSSSENSRTVLYATASSNASSSAEEQQAVAALATSITTGNAENQASSSREASTRSAVPAERRNNGPYALAESTWKTRDKAAERASALRRKGLNAYAMRSGAGKSATYRVLIGSYGSANDAEASKRSLAQRYNLKLAVVTGDS
jgi:D-alanyl-D-alanine carboxypeptidase